MRQTPLVDPGADVLSVAEGQADIPIALAEVRVLPISDLRLIVTLKASIFFRTDSVERDPEPRVSSARRLII